MARKRTGQSLNVFLNGRLTGKLRGETSGAIEFQYVDSWLNWEHTFAISISLPLREDRYVGPVVFAVFDNLLPDNVDIRRRIASRSKAAGADPFNLLAAIGGDCVGALQFLPQGTDPGQPGEITSEPISTSEISARLQNLATAPLGMREDDAFRISIAGAQDKTAFLNMDGAWYLPLKTTATTHILKPQIGQRDNFDLTQSVENEHLCLAIMRALAFPTAHTDILDFDGIRTLVVERFDRQWTKDGRLLRVPQEDCCQAMSVSSTLKYQADGGPGVVDILEFLKASDEPAEDQLMFLKANIAFWLLGATDGHAKNFSVFLYAGGGFKLTPLYDILSTQPLFDAKQLQRKSMKLAMSVGKNRHHRVHDIYPRHFYQSAKAAGVSESTVTTALEYVYTKLPKAIEIACASLPSDFPESLRDSIVEGAMRRRKLIASAV